MHLFSLLLYWSRWEEQVTYSILRRCCTRLRSRFQMHCKHLTTHWLQRHTQWCSRWDSALQVSGTTQDKVEFHIVRCVGDGFSKKNARKLLFGPEQGLALAWKMCILKLGLSSRGWWIGPKASGWMERTWTPQLCLSIQSPAVKFDICNKISQAWRAMDSPWARNRGKSGEQLHEFVQWASETGFNRTTRRQHWTLPSKTTHHLRFSHMTHPSLLNLLCMDLYRQAGSMI